MLPVCTVLYRRLSTIEDILIGLAGLEQLFTGWTDPLFLYFDMTSYVQDGGRDARPLLTAAYTNIQKFSIHRLPAIPPSECDLVGSLYALMLQFLIHSTFVLI